VRISGVITSVLLMMFIVYVFTFVSLGGVNIVTLPWIALMTFALALAVFFAVAGRYVLPWLFKFFGIRYYIGSVEIDGPFAIIADFDSEGQGRRYRGFSVVKLIPTIPSVDMKEDEKKTLIRNTEAYLLSLPSDVEYGIIKTSSVEVQRLINQISSKIASIEAKMRARQGAAAASYERQRSALQAELQRISSSRPVAAMIYVKVFAEGDSVAEVKSKLENLVVNIKNSASSLNCQAVELKGPDLHDFLELQAVSRILRPVLYREF